jgi:hypothetical protein
MPHRNALSAKEDRLIIPNPLDLSFGHVRLTAYLLAPECIPTELEVIAGFAPECALIEGV